MSFQPMLACGSGLLVFILLAPIANFLITFAAGAVCCSLGNKKLGTSLMIGSAAVGVILCPLCFR